MDDILILGPSKQETERRAISLIKLLITLGIRVNREKSMHKAAQTVVYLGHQINLTQNNVSPVPRKLSTSVKMIKHQLKVKTFLPRHVAALAGNLLDACKSNITVQGLPQHLMKLAAVGVRMNNQRLG